MLSDGTTILHGQSGVSNGEQCTCNKGVCNGVSQSCNVTVRATSDSLTRYNVMLFNFYCKLYSHVVYLLL